MDKSQKKGRQSRLSRRKQSLGRTHLLTGGWLEKSSGGLGPVKLYKSWGAAVEVKGSARMVPK